ncbi:MAG: hypothetical protein OXF22_05590 [Anaerolineaceae bacterium]|nr:hypothetical protein [Anaerolineaceae bacterium]
MRKRLRCDLWFISLLFLASCAGGAGDEPGVSAPVAPSVQEQEAQKQTAALLSIPLFDASSGAEFRLSDYAGKTVFIEPMATW